MTTVNPPGKQISIGQIPVAITEDHNEVYYFWQALGIQNAVLFHIDAHPDMTRGARPLNKNLIASLGDPLHYFMTLDIDKFIAPAFYHGLVSSMYWLNPHSSRNLQYMGSSLPQEKERRLETRLTRRWVGYEHITFSGFTVPPLDPPLFDHESNYQGIEKLVEEVAIPKDSPLILDIDLDAFCCSTEDIAGVSTEYRTSRQCLENYTNRINDSMIILSKFESVPHLITISKSCGKKIYSRFLGARDCGETGRDEKGEYLKTDSFLPPELLNVVEEQVMEGLARIYR